MGRLAHGTARCGVVIGAFGAVVLGEILEITDPQGLCQKTLELFGIYEIERGAKFTRLIRDDYRSKDLDLVTKTDLVSSGYGQGSAAGHRHEADDLRLLHLLREVVAIGFDPHAVDDGLAQCCRIARVVAQDRQELERIILAETGIEFALGRNPYPVAAVAEIVAVRRDEAQARRAAGNAPVTCRTARVLIAR